MKKRWAAMLAVTLLLAGCDRAAHRMAPSEASVMPEMKAPAKVRAGPAPAAFVAPDEAPAVRRFIALRHELRVVTPADKLESAWKAAQQACLAADCDVLESSVERDGDNAPPRASLDARVPASQVDAFLAKLAQVGEVGRHTIGSEDKTEEVVDVEARLKNLTEFRDKLRAMLATPGAKLADLVAVQKELMSVQSELDSLNGRRKVLANETEKVRVTVEFRARVSIGEVSTWSPLADAWRDSGRMLAGSVAALFSFVVGAVPWMLALALLVGGVRRWRRRRAAHRAFSPGPG
jgi:hypothetical protein